MVIIEDNIIYLSRGDIATIDLTIPITSDENYVFKIGDKIQFRILKEKGYGKEPVLEKEFEIKEETETFSIDLTEEDTSIGEPINKATTYWYEIAINETNTIIGYDKDEGASKFILLPAKVGDKDVI